jgi:glycosyltransferase involved in cell wall biosynthesis
MNKKKLCIVIPAYNEVKRITPTLKAYVKYFDKHHPDDYYLSVVVNGSSDKTAQIVQKIANLHPQLELTEIKEKIGKGGAVLHGLMKSKCEYVGFADADNSTGPDMMDKLFEFILHNSDYFSAIGSRRLPESKVIGKSAQRGVTTLGFYWLVKILFGLGFKDTQCGAKVMRKKGLNKILDKMTLSDWSFDVDLLFSIRSESYKIKELPIVWEDKDGSKISNRKIQTSIVMFLSLLRLRILHSPLKLFYPILEPFGRFIYHKFK